MLNSGFRKLAAGVAMAVGLGIGSAQAEIDTDGLSSSGGFTSGNGSGELFFSIFDDANDNSLVIDLGILVQDFLANPLAGFSVVSPALQGFIAGGDPSMMEWNIAGLNNDFTNTDPKDIFVLTTVDPDSAPVPFASQAAQFDAMSAAATYVEAVNGLLVMNQSVVTDAGDGVAYYGGSSWGDSFGGNTAMDTAAELGDMEAASMILIGLDGAGGSEVVENGALAQGFWSLDEATGTIAFQPVPLPAAVWLFGSALVGLIGIRRRA